MFDVHTHLNSDEYNSNLDELLKNTAKLDDNCYFLVSGYDLGSSIKSAELSKKYKNIYSSIGIHPSDCKRYRFDVLEDIKKLALDKKVVAIGEIGLDYYWDKEENIKELQRIWFKKQIELANELKLPIVIHTRDAVQDTYDILKDSSFKYPIILHCYNNSLEMTKLYLKMENVYFSFGGVLTFKNASNLREIIKIIPLNRILIETDAPYLSPVPYRGKLNLPEYIFLTLKEMSNILNIDINVIFSEDESCKWTNLELKIIAETTIQEETRVFDWLTIDLNKDNYTFSDDYFENNKTLVQNKLSDYNNLLAVRTKMDELHADYTNYGSVITETEYFKNEVKSVLSQYETLSTYQLDGLNGYNTRFTTYYPTSITDLSVPSDYEALNLHVGITL